MTTTETVERPIELPYRELPGLSPELLAAHYHLYLGYIDRLASALRRIDVFLSGEGDGDEYALSRLFADAGFLRNAILLHELYFENMTPGGAGDPGLVFKNGFRRWLFEFRLLAKAATGWVVLAYCPQTQEVFNFTMRDHGQGFVAGAWPLLVLDCYEHAFYSDYLDDKTAYVEAFLSNVDWECVACRLECARAL